MIRHFFATN